ncbi:MAG TPA: NAD(P)H-dependent oxidoreductase [Gammaproteobacteria bacterium]|nr:NAD(P)H-dependent oxidoreductase [Gammaproteobacteria bacterium]
MGIKVLGMAGSLRKGSYNKLTLRAATELKPADMEIESFDIASIPLYDEDLRERGFPPAVQELREKIRAADALLIVTPEYNYSMPGVLKNAIDWASRPPSQPFDDKPVAIMGASVSKLGTARAQYHLRQTAVFLNMHLINKPEVMISGAANVFDASGRLTDEAARKLIAELLANLAVWSARLKRK